MTADRLPPLRRQREYMLLWGAQVASTLGGSASGIVMPLLMLQLTGSASAAGLASALGVVPYILLSLPVGVWVDRWDRKRVMLWCNAGRATVALAVVLALWLGVLTPGWLYAVTLAQGTLVVFFNLAEVAAMPKVVARAQLPDAIAQNQAGHSGAAIAGPALGTWLLQHAGRAMPFGVEALGHVLSVIGLLRLRTPLAAVPASGPRSLRAEMAVGLRWVWRQALVRHIAALTSLSNLVGAALPLLLILLAKAQGATEAQIGLVFSAGGVGGLLGAISGGWFARRLTFGQVIVGALVIEALMLPLLWLAPGLWALGAAYAAFQFVSPVYNVVQLSRRLAMIPDGLQGRVNSAFRFATTLLFPVGAWLCGVLAEHAGTGAAVAAFTVVMGLVATVAARNPLIRNEGRAQV